MNFQEMIRAFHDISLLCWIAKYWNTSKNQNNTKMVYFVRLLPLLSRIKKEKRSNMWPFLFTLYSNAYSNSTSHLLLLSHFLEWVVWAGPGPWPSSFPPAEKHDPFTSGLPPHETILEHFSMEAYRRNPKKDGRATSGDLSYYGRPEVLLQAPPRWRRSFSPFETTSQQMQYHTACRFCTLLKAGSFHWPREGKHPFLRREPLLQKSWFSSHCFILGCKTA